MSGNGFYNTLKKPINPLLKTDKKNAATPVVTLPDSHT
jgi:hypothetical protein